MLLRIRDWDTQRFVICPAPFSPFPYREQEIKRKEKDRLTTEERGKEKEQKSISSWVDKEWQEETPVLRILIS